MPPQVALSPLCHLTSLNFAVRTRSPARGRRL